MLRLFTPLCALILLLTALPAQAAVTIAFWSHELGSSFPHAFFTLRGVPDAGGAPVDGIYGFTPRRTTPAILFGTVPGRIDIATPSYMAGSDVQFSVVLSDTQYADMLRLVAAWSPETGDARYRLNTRNCVHFVQEAARRAGLTRVVFSGLMKKPRSYLKAVAAANADRVTPIARRGRDYLATLPPLPSTGISSTTSSNDSKRG